MFRTCPVFERPRKPMIPRSMLARGWPGTPLCARFSRPLQFATSAFVHANISHLARNAFVLWLFGSALRREVTTGGLWFTYLASAMGARPASSAACCAVRSE
jgi:membrane associated rhomboid family serine protease